MTRRKHKLSVIFGCIAAVSTASAALAHSDGGHGLYRSGRYGATHQGPSYAGDCKFPYPPGYRYDLRNWRTGFDRDFSCYILDDY